MGNRNRRRRNRNQTGAAGSFITMPLAFARELMRQKTYDPKKNTYGGKTSSYSVYSKEDILTWLQNPTSSSNEKSLRSASNYMYVASTHYNRLLNYYAGLYVGAYVISPISFDKDDIKDNFKKQYRKVTKAIEAMHVPQLLREELLIALRDGAFYGILLSDGNTAFVQKIDPEYCKITAICDGSFLYKVDMTKISSKLEFYPAEFTAMYNNYLATGDQWQEVPLNLSVCIKADDTVLDYTVPPFAATMPSLYTIANAEALQETAQEMKNYKMLAGTIPTNDKGAPLMGNDLVQKYYSHISNALGDNIGLALTPFKLEGFTFENRNGVADVDYLSNSVSNFWSTAGTSGLLHGKENESAGMSKLAIKNDETYVLGMIQQFERVLNRYLKTSFSGSTKFKISILPITVFNREEMLKYYKEAASFGIGKSLYAAALGLSQDDIGGMAYLEKELIPFDELTPLKSSYTTSGNDPGRPEVSEEDLTESGEATRANDGNANR